MSKNPFSSYKPRAYKPKFDKKAVLVHLFRTQVLNEDLEPCHDLKMYNYALQKAEQMMMHLFPVYSFFYYEDFIDRYKEICESNDYPLTLSAFIEYIEQLGGSEIGENIDWSIHLEVNIQSYFDNKINS